MNAVDSLGTDFDALLTRGALWLLAAAAVWATAVVVAVGVETRGTGDVRLAERIGCPPVLRAWLLAAFVALFAAAPAHAGDAGSGSIPSVAIDGLPLPDRTSGDLTTVVVRPGDSLWRIARRVLPADTTQTTVAAAVTRLYAANRRTIGDDPDLLLPGQHLEIETLTSFPHPTTPTEAP
jgi:hypothetical protein